MGTLRTVRTGYGWLAIAALVATGCRRGGGEPLPNRVPTQAALAADPGFTTLCQAAETAQTAAGKLIERTSYYPQQRTMLSQKLAPAVEQAASVGGAPFVYEAPGPFDKRPYREGWRIIGKAMVWRIEDAVAAHKPPEAVQAFLLASRFGFGLTGGDASDATLGLSIVDEARRAILPALPTLDAAGMSKLSQGLKSALAARPGPGAVAANERMRDLRFVQELQDATLKNDLAPFEGSMGRDGRPAVAYLGDIRQKDKELRAYFDGLTAEVNARMDQQTALANKPRSERLDKDGKDLAPKLSEERPWRRFVTHYVLTMPAYRMMDDTSVARTRMLIITAELSRRRKSGQGLPNDLRPFSEGVRTDPFTGHDFVYRTDGTDWVLHSAGEDLTDNGGETDSAGEAPDLTLEPVKP
ncbi:hypothetical protein BH11ARM2_BH11ARM2_30810 [soil metagenome]